MRELKIDNEKCRIDDGYFGKQAVFALRRMAALPSVPLGQASAVFRKGIFDIKAETYTETGVPFVRVGDLRHGVIDRSGIAHIPRAVHDAERKTALRFGDIILSKTAYPAASLVTEPECNVSQDTIAVKLSPEWKEKLPAGYVVAYLNSKYGLALMQRQFQGNVQMHLALPDGRKLPIPLFSGQLQNTVHQMMLSANDQLVAGEDSMRNAERELVQMLGLETWQPPAPVAYIRRASETLLAGRLDAEHYQPQYDALRSRVRGFAHGSCALTDIADISHDTTVPSERPNQQFEYVELSGIVEGTGTIEEVAVLLGKDAPGRARMVLRAGDVVASSVVGSLRKVALVTGVYDGAIGSTGFFVLHPKGVEGEFLLALIRSTVVQEQMLCEASGAILSSVPEGALAKMVVPQVPPQQRAAVAAMVHHAHAARRAARDMLARAKLSIEVAIENTEDAALRLLAELRED